MNAISELGYLNCRAAVSFNSTPKTSDPRRGLVIDEIQARNDSDIEQQNRQPEQCLTLRSCQF